MKGTIRGHGDKTQYLIDGLQVTEEKFFEAFPPVEQGEGVIGASFVGWKPYYSEALAYHPKQIPEARRILESRGLGTEIDRHGRPLMKSRAHRRALVKFNNLHDNDGGYGDG